MIERIDDVEKVIDFSWMLSRDELYRSYPRKESMDAVKEDIERAIKSDTMEVLAYYQEEVLLGVCVYYWLTEDKYAQTNLFLIKDKYDLVADAFLEYIGHSLRGFEMMMGFPASNDIAKQYFKKKQVPCVDSSSDTRLYNLGKQTSKKEVCIEQITEEHYECYRDFHDAYAIPLEMYFNADNLKKNLERFRIWVYKEAQIKASIFIKAGKELSEIFGLFIDESVKNKGVEALLIKALLRAMYDEFGEIKEVVYFINDGETEELNAALAAGFEINDNYRCYRYLL